MAHMPLTGTPELTVIRHANLLTDPTIRPRAKMLGVVLVTQHNTTQRVVPPQLRAQYRPQLLEMLQLLCVSLPVLLAQCRKPRQPPRHHLGEMKGGTNPT